MASKEDYLDQLLKEMMDGGMPEPVSEPEPMPEPEDEADDAPGEDDIERMLAEARAGAEEPDADEVRPEDQDLMELLSDSDDSDMDELHDLLQKNDENIAVDDNIFASENDEPDLDAVLEEPAEVLSPREQKKREREKARAEKAAARAEAKARKKEAAEARKAAKAEKKHTKQSKQAPEPEEPESEGISFDTDLTPADAETDMPQAPEKPIDLSAPLEVDMSDMDALLGLDNIISDEATRPEAASETAAADAEIKLEENWDQGETASANPDEAEAAPPGDIAAEDGQEPDQPTKKSKKGFLAKIMDLLIEEPLDDEEEQKGTEDVPMSDENKEILEELDQEDGKGKKGGKDKKEKKKKEKKPKKPKKEKAPKGEKEPGEPKKKIPVKKILPLVFLGITVFAAIFLIVKVGGSAISKSHAKQAFYKEDYETCYQELYGKDLTESEQVMYAKSESILRINLWMREYEIYVDEGSEVEALDVLIQAVEDYPLLETYASEWNAYSEVRAVYEEMLTILSDKYHLTEEQAQAIAAEKDDEEYTRQVTAMASGAEYDSWNEPVYETEQLPDMLPEEQNFQENQIQIQQ